MLKEGSIRGFSKSTSEPVVEREGVALREDPLVCLLLLENDIPASRLLLLERNLTDFYKKSLLGLAQ